MKKKFVFLFLLFSIFPAASFSQLKIGYVDSDTIMDNLPDVQDARQKLDAIIQDWQNELNKMDADWKAKYDDYQKRKLIMTDQTRAEVEAELVTLENKTSDFREKKFGSNGELFQKQDELMKPIQNKIFNVIQQIAKEEDFDYIFDRSGDIMLLFAKEEYDLTSKVLERLNME